MSIPKKNLKVAVVITDDYHSRVWHDHSSLMKDLRSNALECDLVNLAECKSSSHKSRESLNSSDLLLTLNWYSSSQVLPSVAFSIERWEKGDRVSSLLSQHDRSRLKDLILFLKAKIASNRVARAFMFTLFSYLARVGRNRFISRFQLDSYDYLVIPSSRMNSESWAILEKFGSKCIIAVDNWDNLTAKNAFPVTPEFMTVMGSSAVNADLKVRLGIEGTTMLPIGLPKFDYLRAAGKRTTSLPPRDSLNVLYVGFSLPYDATRALRIIESCFLSKFPNKALNFRYRPHPSQRIKPEFPSPDWRTSHATLENAGSIKLPRLDEDYDEDFSWAHIVIGPPTSMMLEAACFGLPVLLDLCDDSLHRTSPARCWDKYEHHRDLEIVGVKTFSTSEQLSVRLAAGQDDFKHLVIPRGGLIKVVNLEPKTYGQQLNRLIISGL